MSDGVELRRCDGEVIPWDELDPGIVGAVRSLLAAGLQPHDSGDGYSKRAAGWEEGSYGDVPHVAVATSWESLAADAQRLLEWACGVASTEPGRADSDLSVQAVFAPGHEPILWVAGDALLRVTP